MDGFRDYESNRPSLSSLQNEPYLTQLFEDTSYSQVKIISEDDAEFFQIRQDYAKRARASYSAILGEGEIVELKRFAQSPISSSAFPEFNDTLRNIGRYRWKIQEAAQGINTHKDYVTKLLLSAFTAIEPENVESLEAQITQRGIENVIEDKNIIPQQVIAKMVVLNYENIIAVRRKFEPIYAQKIALTRKTIVDHSESLGLDRKVVLERLEDVSSVVITDPLAGTDSGANNVVSGVIMINTLEVTEDIEDDVLFEEILHHAERVDLVRKVLKETGQVIVDHLEAHEISPDPFRLTLWESYLQTREKYGNRLGESDVKHLLDLQIAHAGYTHFSFNEIPANIIRYCIKFKLDLPQNAEELEHFVQSYIPNSDLYKKDYLKFLEAVKLFDGNDQKYVTQFVLQPFLPASALSYYRN